jgi:hypothetical protein
MQVSAWAAAITIAIAIPGLMMVNAVPYHAGEPVREIVWALPSEGFGPGDTVGARQAVARLGLRYGGCQYAADGFMVVREWWYKTRKERAHLVTTRDAVYKYHAVLYDRSSEDRYGNPGDFVMRRHPVYGTLVLWTIPSATPGAARLMLTGAGASPDGDRPFMDVLDLGVADQQVMHGLHATLISLAILYCPCMGAIGERKVGNPNGAHPIAGC